MNKYWLILALLIARVRSFDHCGYAVDFGERFLAFGSTFLDKDSYPGIRQFVCRYKYHLWKLGSDLLFGISHHLLQGSPLSEATLDYRTPTALPETPSFESVELQYPATVLNWISAYSTLPFPVGTHSRCLPSIGSSPISERMMTARISPRWDWWEPIVTVR